MRRQLHHAPVALRRIPSERLRVNHLDHYLSTDHPTDSRDLQDAHKLACSVAQVYDQEFSETAAWPYEIGCPTESLSQSTTAMILCALLRFGGYLRNDQFPLKTGSSQLDAALPEKILKASTLLLEKVLSEKDGKAVLQTTSRTYGSNDIFTLAWLAEITDAKWSKVVSDSSPQLIADPEDAPVVKKWKQVKCELDRIAQELIEKWRNEKEPPVLFTPENGAACPHAFPALRLLQIVRGIHGPDFGALPDLYAHFEKSLHEQLSFSSIPDSRFDPAEMVFCLEGMLLCQKNTVDRTVFDRVLAVLSDAQRENAYWRPVKPFLVHQVGLVLFPVSVEIANSLIRSCEIFDGDELRDTYASKAVAMLRRYFQWLRARAVRLRRPGTDAGTGTEKKEPYEAVGWHSEHVNVPTLIHLWETSQVLDFLLAYRNSLSLHVARTTLVLSRFKTDSFAEKSWDKLQGALEPVTALGTDLKVYRDIGELFVAKNTAGLPSHYSMLLYGPAGTGKTTVAESIAQSLKRRLITVTVSDFLAEGGAQVEARAKNIFEVLMAQPPSVILFDEIDHFLLDRDSPRYRDQETLFQFMTPGMLTKLNDLRRSERSIFIVATNYEDRIDPAIKRTGRIDKKYLVLPPDAKQRKNILRSFLEKPISAAFVAALSDDHWKQIQEASVFLGYKDLQAAVGALLRLGETPQVDKFVEQLGAQARTTSLEAYASRFKEGEKLVLPSSAPVGEFLVLVAMLAESGREPNERERSVFSTFLQMLGEKSLTDETLKKFAPQLDAAWWNKVKTLLGSSVGSGA